MNTGLNTEIRKAKHLKLKSREQNMEGNTNNTSLTSYN